MLPVVLIHGLFGAFGDERVWSRLAPRRVLAPDLLGYGQSVAVDGPVTVDAQVDHLRSLLGSDRVHLVGHSIGGVLAAVYTHRHPGDVASFVNVEGNFTLADAFWSSELAKKPADEAEALLAGYRADPAGWLGGSPSADQVASASRMLNFQPARTMQAMAASIVAVTGAPNWQSLLKEVFACTPVHLVAGEHSRSAWNVPDWALRRARSYTEMPGVGHLMPIERPEAFGELLSGLLEP